MLVFGIAKTECFPLHRDVPKEAMGYGFQGNGLASTRDFSSRGNKTAKQLDCQSLFQLIPFADQLGASFGALLFSLGKLTNGCVSTGQSYHRFSY